MAQAVYSRSSEAPAGVCILHHYQGGFEPVQVVLFTIPKSVNIYILCLNLYFTASSALALLPAESLRVLRACRNISVLLPVCALYLNTP